MGERTEAYTSEIRPASGPPYKGAYYTVNGKRIYVHVQLEPETHR